MNNHALPEASNPAFEVTLEPNDHRRLANLCGQFNQHLRQIEQRLGIEVHNRANRFSLVGKPSVTKIVATLLRELYQETQSSQLTPNDIHLTLQSSGLNAYMQQSESIKSASALDTNEQSTDSALQREGGSIVIRTKKATIKPRGGHQQGYVRAIQSNDINFGVGPAGTGKTYLAVACAVESLLNDDVERILLVRPAVEAGEKLGFLPGDLAQKVDPYLRPLYDALFEMLGFEVVAKLMERNVIEVAPLAYMRGRTLNNAFVILDESQNTTPEQMKMFLTRLGFGSTAVITGDPTQIDLPRGQKSGLKQVIHVLDGVGGISFTHFDSKDVVRHPLVQRIVEAYDAFDSESA